jgi:hypothetical protein
LARHRRTDLEDRDRQRSEDVADALLPAAGSSAARRFTVDPDRCPPRVVERAGEAAIEAILRFETAVGEGAGLVRIKRADAAAGDTPQAWTLLTALRSLTGHDEETVRQRREDPPFERDFRGPNWLDRRREAVRYADRDPAVLIVGGGHAGLTAAASLKALGVEALVVDRMERVGDNWRLRYHGLKLHNQVHSNHLPYLPFPKTWPNYIPKDKIADWLEFYVEALEIDFWTRRRSRAPATTPPRASGRRGSARPTAACARCARGTSSWPPASAARRTSPKYRPWTASAARWCIPAASRTARSGGAGASSSSAPAPARTTSPRTCTATARA